LCVWSLFEVFSFKDSRYAKKKEKKHREAASLLLLVARFSVDVDNKKIINCGIQKALLMMEAQKRETKK
jgi:hypothetical protein